MKNTDLQEEFELFVKALGGNIGEDFGQYRLSEGSHGYRVYRKDEVISIEPFASQSLSANEMYHALRFARAAIREYQKFAERK